MSDAKDVFRVQNYYPQFAHCSLPATFAFLREPEISALVNGEYTGRNAESAIRRISEAMRPFRGRPTLPHRPIPRVFFPPNAAPLFRRRARGIRLRAAQKSALLPLRETSSASASANSASSMSRASSVSL